MVVADLMAILREANPEAPILIDYFGLLSEIDSVEVQNGLVHIQGYCA